MRRIISFLLVILLLFAACGKKQPEGPVSELMGTGYQSLYQVGNVCYLTDDSGVIYTLDLVTGEKVLYGKPPVRDHWVADPLLTCIYYLKDDSLCRYRFSSETEEVVCKLQEYDRLYAATEDYILYTSAFRPSEEDPYLFENHVVSLNLSTLETQEMVDIRGELIGTEQGNVICYADVETLIPEDGSPPKDQWSFGVADLDTGERTLLLEQELTSVYENQLAVIGDVVYFIHNSAVYAMPVTGGEKTPISPYTNNWKLVPCGEKGILVSAVGPKDTTVWYYDVRTGATITISNITDSVESMASDRKRYAILTHDYSGDGKILFGDIPQIID